MADGDSPTLRRADLPHGAASPGEPPTPDTVGGQPELVLRPRAVELIAPVPATPVTVLRAPVGYGKSLVTSRWASTRSQWPVAWVRLRRSDHSALVARRILDAFGEVGIAVTRPPTRGGAVAELRDLRHVLADLGRRPGDAGGVVLVLDDADAPARTALVDQVEHWIASLPPTVCTVLNRRTAPGPALSRLGHGLTVLGASDLAFTDQEALSVVDRVAGITLDDAQLHALMGRTEGWPFAVQIVATALRANPDADRVLDRIHGTDHSLRAVFTAEVLQRESEVVRRFMVRTSVLEQLDPRLCTELTGDARAAPMLQLLERHGAFTESDPDGSGTYRYHPLLRDFLRDRLRTVDPGAERSMLAHATGWYTACGHLEAAVDCATRSEDPDQVLRIVDGFTRPLFEQGHLEPMLEILDTVPDDARPDVPLRRAYLLTMLGETRRARLALRDAEGDEVDAGTRAVAQALRATWVYFDATAQSAIRAADRTLELLRSTDPSSVPDILGLTTPDQLEVLARGARARARWCTGELESSREDFLDLLRRTDLYAPWHLHLLSSTAILEAWSGHLHAALTLARRATLLAHDHGLLRHPATLDSYLAAAQVLIERDDLTRSDRLLATVESRLGRQRRPTTVAMCTAVRAAWCLAAGRPEQGLAALRELRVNGDPPPPARVDERLRATEARLLVERGELIRAEAAARPALDNADPALPAAAVRVAVARGDLQSAGERLAAWVDRPTDLTGRIERDLWSAILDCEKGDRAAAVQRLGRVVVPLAAREGHRRVFLDAGQPGERALRALHRTNPSRMVQELLQGAEARRVVVGGATLGLSERELEILRYLPTDLPSAEIASRLFISLNTLKTHLRVVYRKLDVGSRADAVARAAELGLA